MQKAIVFIESSGSGAGEATAVAAREAGLIPIVFCRDPSTYPFFTEISVETLIADTRSLDAILEACLQLSQQFQLAGVGTTAEYFAEMTARVAQRLQLRGPNPDSVTICRAKDKMRAALQAAANLNPRYCLVESPDEARIAAKALGCPVILKPTILSGSALVQLCNDASAAFQHARKLLRLEVVDGFHMPKHILVEEYVDGPEFSVEILDGESLGITKKRLGPPPYFVEIGHDFPADLDDDDWKAVTEAALEAAAAVGLQWGPAHIEVKLGTDGPRVIEVNPRMAGGRIPHLIKYATGMDFASAYVSELIGETPRLRQTRRGGASVRFVTVPENGIFRGLKGLDSARYMDGIAEAKIAARTGKEYKLLHSNGDRIGYVIATGASILESSLRAETALQGLSLDWELEASRKPVAAASIL